MTAQTLEGLELVVDAKNTLGEGVLWCERRRRVYWTDIEASTVWEYNPLTRQTRTWRTPARVGALADGGGERLLIGLEKQLAYLDLNDGQITALIDVERDIPETRVNDGRCDRAGNFVFGTLNDARDGRSLGSFYQYSRSHGLRRLALPKVRISNSICFSMDGRTLYYCDTPTREIHCCAYDADSAAVGAARVFSLVAGAGTPDGSVVDAQGYLWNAEWGAARIVRYSPQGKVDAIVPMPVPNPTCMIFGAAELDEMYITTSRQEMSAAQLAAMPHAGGLYRIRLPVRGPHEAVFSDRPDRRVETRARDHA